MAISRKRRQFCHEYIKDFIGAQAAVRAGYSERSSRVTASRLLADANVQGYMGEIIEEAKMGKDEAAILIAEVARATPEAFVTFDNNTWKIDIPKAKREGKLGLIKSIVPTPNGIKVELHDKMRALELIGKHHHLFDEKIQHEVTGQITHKIDGFEDFLSKVYGQPDGARELPENG